MPTRRWKRLIETSDGQEKVRITSRQSPLSFSAQTSDMDEVDGSGSTSRPRKGAPPNIKFITGVPWELDELPRQLSPNSETPERMLGSLTSNYRQASKSRTEPSHASVVIRPRRGSSSKSTDKSSLSVDSASRRAKISNTQTNTQRLAAVPGSDSAREENIKQGPGKREESTSPERKSQQPRAVTLAKMLSTLKK